MQKKVKKFVGYVGCPIQPIKESKKIRAME
jgi:hypothetical protein